MALEATGADLGPDVRVVEPLGYRTSLAAQLHAAAVLTDSGGVQREAAWLGVPCLVLRGTTEWVEAVAGSGGGWSSSASTRTGRVAELARLAPAGDRPRRRPRTRAVGVTSSPPAPPSGSARPSHGDRRRAAA